MDYRILEVHSDSVSSEIISKIEKFCRLAFAETKHAARENMQADDWQNHASSLLYLLVIEKRFSQANGGLHLLMQNDDVIGCSGYYRADFCPDIFLMGVRSWVLKEHRLQLLLTQNLIPLQLEQIRLKGGQIAAVSFNESTRSFAKLIERTNKNPDATKQLFFGENYPDFYKDMKVLEYPVRIKGVKQWILIKNLSDYKFDWSAIAYNT